jgi:hypothetical protein
MKQLFTVLTITFASVFLTSSVSKNKELAKIRSRFDEIQTNLQNKNYYVKNLSEKDTDESIMAYLKEGKTEMIQSEIGGAAGRLRYEYFYDKNNQLVMVIQQFYKYNRPMYYDEATAIANGDDEYFDPEKTKILENRFYYNNQKLIQWTNPQHEVVSLKNVDFQSKGKNFMGRSLNLVARLTETPKNDEIISKHQQNRNAPQLARGESAQRRAGSTRL